MIVAERLVELVDLGLLLLSLIEVLHNVGNVIIVLGSAGGGGLRSGVLSVHGLVRFGELAKGGERVRAKLVEDTGNEFGKLLVNAVTVDGEGVGRGKTVN